MKNVWPSSECKLLFIMTTLFLQMTRIKDGCCADIETKPKDNEPKKQSKRSLRSDELTNDANKFS